MSMPDFEAWAIFASVAEHRSITGAAAALGLSKATVSKAITRLETRLGVTLFHRTSRRLTLSDSGTALAVRARAIVAEALEAEDCAREEAAAPSGTVRLAVPMSFGLSHVAPVLARFLTVYPDVAVDLHLSDARVDLVAEGFDIAVRIGQLADSSLRARTLRSVSLGLYAAPAYLERFGTPRHPRDLKAHRLFCYSYAVNEQYLKLSRGGEEEIVALAGRMRANNADVMVPAAIAGLGIAPLPDFIGIDARASGAIVPVLADWHAPPTALHLVTPPGRLRPRRVEVLLEFLATALSATG